MTPEIKKIEIGMQDGMLGEVIISRYGRDSWVDGRGIIHTGYYSMKSEEIEKMIYKKFVRIVHNI